MRRDIVCIGALVLILAVVIGAGMVSSPFLIHGYDTPIAQITEIDHNYSPRYADVRESIFSNEARVYPYAEDIHDLFTETGLRMEISSAVKILETPKEYIETIYEVDHEAETNTSISWDVHKVKCSIGVTVWTYEGGIAKTGETIFWITLSSNPSSIFMGLDEHYDFFVNVYNREPVRIVGEMEVVPTATIEYLYDPVETDKVPQWIIDSGYTGELNNHRSIKFPVKILNAEPTTYIDFGGLQRAEASATFDIGIDVILVGYWEQEVDYREHIIPVLDDLIGDLITFLTLMAWVIVGFVATIVIFRFVPDMKLKLIATIIVWGVLIGIYGISAIQTWMGGAG